jgi:two-component system response regulator DesR
MLATLVLLDDRTLDVRSICEATTGEEAAEYARIYRPHVALMDIGLPGINGIEAARRIKEDASSTAIVFVTASEEPGQRQEAVELGAVGFLTKDRVALELVPLLSRILGQGGRLEK